jgi:plastocyanin
VTRFEVVGKDFAFELPAPNVAAGPTTIALKNDGAEAHQAQVARINDGKTFADLTAALQGPDESAALALIELSGGPTNVDPGETVSTTTNLTPGTYAFLCFVAGDDGIPHIAKGMVASVTVDEPAVTAELPVGDVEIIGKDFTYEIPNPVPADTETITFVNDGPQPHEASIFKLADGVTVDDIKGMLASTEPPTGPPPFTNAGGIAGITTGETALIDVDLEAGEYVLICFIPDPATGQPHANLGMVVGMTVQ